MARRYFRGDSGPYLKLTIDRRGAALVFTGGNRRRFKIKAAIKGANRRRGTIHLEAVDVGIGQRDGRGGRTSAVIDRIDVTRENRRSLTRYIAHSKAWLVLNAGRLFGGAGPANYAQAARATATLDGQTISVVVTRGSFDDVALDALDAL